MKKLTIATMVALTLSTTAVFADVKAQSGGYVGGFAGWSFPFSPDYENSNGVNTSESDKNFTLGATLGYQYAFNDNVLLGVEASYLDFGKNDYKVNYKTTDVYGNLYTVNAAQTLKNSGLQLMLVGTYLMNNGFNMFAKLGAIHETTNDSIGVTVTDSNSNSISRSRDYSVSSWLPAMAVGVGYMPIQNLNVALQYEHVFGEDWNDPNYTSNGYPDRPMAQNVVTLGITYTIPL